MEHIILNTLYGTHNIEYLIWNIYYWIPYMEYMLLDMKYILVSITSVVIEIDSVVYIRVTCQNQVIIFTKAIHEIACFFYLLNCVEQMLHLNIHNSMYSFVGYVPTRLELPVKQVMQF